MYTLKLSPTHFVGSKSAATASSSGGAALDPTALLTTLAALQKDEREQPLSSLANHHPALGFSSHSLREVVSAPKPKLVGKSLPNHDDDDSLESSAVPLPHCLPFRPALSSSSSSISSSSPPVGVTKQFSSTEETAGSDSAEKKRKRKKKNKRNSKENGDDRSASPPHNGQQQQHENGISDTESDAANSPASSSAQSATSPSAPSAQHSASHTSHQNGTKSSNKVQKKKSSPSSVQSSSGASSTAEDSHLLTVPVSALRTLFRNSLHAALDNVFNTVEDAQQKQRMNSSVNPPPVLTAKVKKELLRKAETELLEKFMKTVKSTAAKANVAATATLPSTTVAPTTALSSGTASAIESEKPQTDSTGS